jgi:D-amino-acid dehydrogenase
MRFAMSAPEDRTAIVVGAGVVGMACALAMQARGWAVTVVDPGTVRAASVGNAGHIAVEQVEPLASAATLRSLPNQLFLRGGPVSLPWREIGAWLPFGLRFAAAARPARYRAGKAALTGIAAAAVSAWRRQLDRIGRPDLLREQGHYVVWESARAAAVGRARWQAIDTGTVAKRDATVDELVAIAGHLAVPLAGGLRFEGSAQIADLDVLAAALAEDFAAKGGTRLRRSAAAIVRQGDRTAVALDDGTVRAGGAVVVAAGTASGRLLAPLGHCAPVIAERGYHLQLAGTDWPADMPPVVFEERGFLLTRFVSGLRVAGFFEFGRPESPADPRKWARLRAHLEALGLAGGAAAAEWMGARPTLPDYLPAIGRSTRLDGLFYAFGHQHLGLTLSAATGEAIAALVDGEAPAFEPAPFALERFGAR